MCRFLITVAALVFTPLFCFGQVPFPQLLQPMATFSLETKDWGIDATTSPKQAAHNPTPITIPGARVIKTLELKALVEINKKIIVVDVLDDTSRSSIPGAVWLPGAGDGRLFGAEKTDWPQLLTN